MTRFLDRVARYHWAMYEYQHDDLRGEPLPLWFNVVTTATTIVLLVCGQ